MHIERKLNQMNGICGEWWMYNAYRQLKSDTVTNYMREIVS